jgi:hypothetical protein
VITIDNPNPLAIEDLWLQVKELPSLSSGTAIQQIVPANDRITFKIPTIYPELPPGLNSNRLSLSGTLTYRYHHAETSTVSLDDNSAIVINQIFSSGLDIDEFL